MDSVHQKMFCSYVPKWNLLPKNGRGGKLQGLLQNLHFHTYIDPFALAIEFWPL